MLNQFPYYRHNNYYNRFSPTFTSNYNPYINNINYNNQNISDNLKEVNNNNLHVENVNSNNNQEETNNKDTSHYDVHKFGPLSIDNDRLSIFGFNIQIDDLLIIGLILILLLETEKNLPLIIVLGLMLFNVNFSSLHLF